MCVLVRGTAEPSCSVQMGDGRCKAKCTFGPDTVNMRHGMVSTVSEAF